ncbi:putative Ig domain-containing protein [Rhodococcus erythropolis]|uniref:putative Ig domain-containing protein n=1 Tax=Rhodococcus erythropolis TaxID=1833 RepID=UPI00406BC14D
MITIEIAPTLTGAPSAGVVGQPYTHAFTVTGQPAPTVTAGGALPAGLTLTETGVLSGTPTETGSFAVTFTASNGIGTPATLDATLTITAAPEPPATGSLGSLGNFGS